MSTIKRSKRQTPFVQIDKRPLQDKALGWKAKGILAYLLSLPDDWQLYVDELKDHAKDGRDSTSAGLNELIKHGYVTRHKKRSEEGRFKGYEYTVYETPQKQPAQTETPKTDKPQTGKPSTVNPKTDKPKSVNPQLLILDNTNKEDTNKYNGKKDLPKLSAPSFDEFWEKYRHKKNKQQAVKSWSKLNAQDKINAVAAIPQYLKYLIAKTHPQCHASTWINNRRWEDDNSTEAETININGTKSITTQPQAKEILRNLYSAYPDKWKQQYTNQAQTDYVKALTLFYKDNPELKTA